MPRQAQGMIAGRGRDDSRLRLPGSEEGKGIARSTLLEAAGPLQVFLLAENLRAGDLAQGMGFHALRSDNGAAQSSARGHDLRQRDGESLRSGGIGSDGVHGFGQKKALSRELRATGFSSAMD